ncbi:MAG: hypothetical protein JWR03_250 [Cohnella sp.]|nr:hypothetical protein [Cohnella sp.]
MSETVKCAYCGTKRPASELKPGKIFYRDRHPRTGKAFLNEKTNPYCADKPCHANDQMAHEG